MSSLGDRRLVNAEPAGDLALEQAEVEPALSEVVAEGPELAGISRGKGSKSL